MTVEHQPEPVDPLRRPGIHRVRHRRRSDLTRTEPLGGQFVAGHQPQGGGGASWCRRRLDQRRNDVEIKGAGVHLADRIEHAREAEMRSDRLFEFIDRLGATQQIELIEPCADRSLESTQRIAGQQLTNPLKADHGLLGDVGESLAEGGRLGGDIVGPCHHDLASVLFSKRGEASEERNETVVDHAK